MIQQSIKRKIVSIAVGLIVLMVVTSALSMVMSSRVAHQLDELSTKYVEAYGHLARMNVRSLEGSLAIRRMVVAKMQTPPDEAGYAERLKVFEATGLQIDQEAAAARQLINAVIDDMTTETDTAGMARIESRIESVSSELGHQLKTENAQLLQLLDTRDFAEARRSLMRIDALRDEFDHRIEAIRADMLAQVRLDAVVTMRQQRQAIWVSAIVTALAATVGLLFAILVSDGIARPVRHLLEGTRKVEAGQFDGSVAVVTRDEIGQLSAAFNRMVEKLRHNERIRETFGRYIDPQVLEGLVEGPALAVAAGERRVMTVMFCDMRGFTSLSEGVTPQGLVKVMNRYLTIMSEPIRGHRGIIDKYIGDAIMAYWGPPFVDAADQAGFACLAAIDMLGRVATLRKELPELLGVRSLPLECDLRIGIATGEALVGSIGSEFMMSYTVMGDTVNLASRLEGANKIYGTHSLLSQSTVAAAGDTIETREIDRLVVAGQTQSQAVYEIMGRKDELTPQQLLLRSSYSEGLAAYRARRWDQARSAFNAALEAVPGDGPSTALARRIDHFQANPPADDWNGSWYLDHK
ncbi:MAG: adenylate cyclase [Tardiphaga sp.]|jgi:adenylate cyclase|nr:adenylate cyclase [Tardiphaga sp.]